MQNISKAPIQSRTSALTFQGSTSRSTDAPSPNAAHAMHAQHLFMSS